MKGTRITCTCWCALFRMLENAGHSIGGSPHGDRITPNRIAFFHAIKSVSNPGQTYSTPSTYITVTLTQRLRHVLQWPWHCVCVVYYSGPDTASASCITVALTLRLRRVLQWSWHCVCVMYYSGPDAASSWSTCIIRSGRARNVSKNNGCRIGELLLYLQPSVSTKYACTTLKIQVVSIRNYMTRTLPFCLFERA